MIEIIEMTYLPVLDMVIATVLCITLGFLVYAAWHIITGLLARIRQ